MLLKLHLGSASLGLGLIALFWTGTIAIELAGTDPQIALVKTAVAFGLLLLIPALATAGITGTKLAHGRQAPLIAAKSRRMKLIAANGVLVLVPCALALAWMARSGQFGTLFYAVQGVELLAGAGNITLLLRNMRAGRRLTRGRRRGA